MHVTTDTHSGFLMPLHTLEKYVITHCLKRFSYMGMPKTIKMSNGSGYVSKAFQQFCPQSIIEHKTGIPLNPQGQGIVEPAYGSLKTQLIKIKMVELYPQFPHKPLNHALFTLNLLNMDNSEKYDTERFWHDGTRATFTKAKWKDPCTGLWEGPDPVLKWGQE